MALARARILAGPCRLNSAWLRGGQAPWRGVGTRVAMTECSCCPLLSVRPQRGLVDEKFRIVLRNLLPKQEVTLRSLHHSEDKDFWEAFGHYISDENGVINVVEDASVGGTYVGRKPMGLLWSMKPIPGSRSGLRLRKKDVFKPLVVTVSVYGGHVSKGFSEIKALATVVTERWYTAPGVQRVDIDEHEVKGTLFLPPGPGPFPGVLDLWGGGGGLVEYRAALLASHGYASLALEYLSPDRLDVKPSYFEKAYQVLQSHHLVAPDRMALLGLCLGACVTLTLVAHSKVVQPQCCVSINGSHVLPVDQSIDQAFLHFNKNVDKMVTDKNNHIIGRNHILPISSDPAQKVAVGSIKCPVLLVVGEDDQSWATLESAEDMTEMMSKAGNDHLLTVLSYPGAGHLIEPPYTPHFRFSNFTFQGSNQKVVLLWGGHTEPHAHAQEDSWEKILLFLQQHLHKSQDFLHQAKL
ncbi:acyl-coenzyme A thioesterase 4-like isoform X1 [Denticeps clupeoides]|uniref:Uncharacterized protein n=1 Tax=Denticeps clupeoides TaxID=299321 RepID=A0AAY4ENK4_9TELE|nr:acyl-coenzyme A thioesterase 4-like isoform X1 [Denticeps clupeoides]